MEVTLETDGVSEIPINSDRFFKRIRKQNKKTTPNVHDQFFEVCGFRDTGLATLVWFGECWG